jgi:PAS domain-containing protein
MVARNQVGSGLTDLRREVVARLRERNAGLRDAVAPLIDEFDRLLGSGETLAVSNVDRLRRGHETLLDALAERYDKLDAAVRESEIPFAEIDGAGRITYANGAFEVLVTQARGQPRGLDG